MSVYVDPNDLFPLPTSSTAQCDVMTTHKGRRVDLGSCHQPRATGDVSDTSLTLRCPVAFTTSVLCTVTSALGTPGGGRTVDSVKFSDDIINIITPDRMCLRATRGHAPVWMILFQLNFKTVMLLYDIIPVEL